MKIVGIDPGTRRVGYGVIEKVRGGATLLEADLLPITAKTDAEALVQIKRSIDELLARVNPDVVAIEKLFFSNNQKTAMHVAEARGVIVLAAAEQKLRIKEYTPNEVKTVCTGYGRADKKAVAKMVKLMLKTPELSVIDDVTDALAIAICALQYEKLER